MPEGKRLNEIYHIFKNENNNVEYLISYEGNDFSIFEDFEREILYEKI